MTLSAREAALDILGTVLRRRRPLDEVLEGQPGLSLLDDRDRAFTRLLVATTLRRLGQIDDLVGRFLDKPLPERAADVRDILRLGACQLAFLGTAPHAAVATAVDLAEQRGWHGLKPLVNAVLRRVDRDGLSLVAGQDAARLNTPAWLWESWCAAYGEPTVQAMALIHAAEPPLDISVKADAEGWADRLQARILPTGSLRRPAGGRVSELPGYDEGAWWVQDTAASLPVRLLGDVAGRRVADLCAAPGGKTIQLAAAGAEVVAVDRSARRLERVAGNLRRMGLAARLVAADAAAWRPDGPLDAVLLDAPCSATGTLRRHPDVAWLKSPEDVGKLAAAQARLLEAAVAMLKPGGLLVYCVCSLQPDEGPQRVAELLAAGAPLRRLPVDAAELGGLAELLTAEGDLRTLPCHLAAEGGMDGFFACRLQRV